MLDRNRLDRRYFLGAGLSASALACGGLPLRAMAQETRLTTVGGTAKTRYGSVRGRLKDGVHQFFCVPYGAPTGGANRFMPPRPPAAWSGVKDHFEITWAAPMEPGGEEPAPVVTAVNRLTPQSEDCLTINIFTPGVDNKARPVMVWMHGGGFSAGSGNYLLYDGTNLAKKEDVVVIGVNHRLNVFGFLHLADIGGEQWAGATNVGVQDLVAVLQWVKDNVENFGGDPSRVTIFGQSGGGGKTTTVMAMPSAQGLFHRCIAQSGSAIRGQTASAASEAAERFIAKLGIQKNQLQRLQQMDWRDIQKAYYSEPAIAGLGGGPVIDGKIIPRNQWDPTAPSFSANVPLMIGSTENENGWLGPPPYELPDAEMQQLFTTRLAGNDAAEGQKLLALYKRRHPDTRNRMLWLMAEADDSRRTNAQLLCRLKAEQGSAASYLYFFHWQSPVHNHQMGSYHTLDIPFVFYNLDIASSMTGAAQQRYQLGHVMSAAWAAFARTGNPNHADMPNWPAFTPNELPTMMFGDQVAVVNDPNKEERLALAALRAKRPAARG
ncbi:MAG: carboxylesterase family protein [Nevskiaceae bacterium]|jgi:para-nitrobenzyl esterase|nr:carboxylesterase family protein [Nevskiaceae bacterium]